jgi:predicted PurR-regulated permease PerM
MGGASFDNYMRIFHTEIGTIFNFLGQVVIVLVYLVFVLAEHARVPKRVHQAFHAKQSAYLMNILDRINGSISRYVTVKTFVSLLTGVFTYCVLRIFQVDYAIVWAVIAFLFHYIPYVGPVVAVVLPSLLCLVQHESIWWAFAVLFLLNLVQTVIGYIVEPLLFGKRLDLSPLVIIASLAFWATIWGVVGMILAIPMVVVCKTILENIPDTRPLARMISDV